MPKITLDDPKDYLIYRSGSGASIEIVDIVVGTKRGVGRGRNLIELLLIQLEKDTNLVYAITRESNKKAHAFYKAVGFNYLGSLREFYRDTDESAFVFGLDV